MAAVQRQLVHKQFNSPMGLYSPENIEATLNRELKAFGNNGIETDNQIARPLNLACSEVLRAVEEEEQMKCGYKRVAWPPASEERIVREFTPQPQTQQQPLPTYNQQQNQPSAVANGAYAVPSNQQQYRAQSVDINQPSQLYQQSPQQQQQQQQYLPQASQNLYQQPPKAGIYNQSPSQQPAWVQQHSAQPQQQSQQQYQQPPWVQQSQQAQQYQQQQQQFQYQNPLNQYNQASNHYQQQQQQYPLQQNQFLPQTNQQQFNSYSQHQQQQHTVSHDQVDQQANLSQDQRGTSPGIITLRKEAPITQKPTPIYTSQPAAISFRESSTDSQGGSNMRGDLKWPPPEYKEAAAKENEERRKLALGPVCRPRKVNRDYTSFFAKNALSHHYPSYKVPPGTQHMIN